VSNFSRRIACSRRFRGAAIGKNIEEHVAVQQPILAQAANAIVLIRERLSKSVLLQQFHRVSDRLLAEELLVPLIAIEPEKAARPLRTFRIADEELHVHALSKVNRRLT